MSEVRRAPSSGRTAPLQSKSAKQLSAAAGVRAGRPRAMVDQIESGLRLGIVDRVARDLEMPAASVRKLAKISSSTFRRREKTGYLSAEESDRMFRLQSIVHKTAEFFEGDKVAARHWLKQPAPALRGSRPIDMLVNEAGVREVESLLGRLEYGVFT